MNKYDDTDYQIEREESIEYEEKSNIEEDEKIMKSLEYELDKIIIRSSKVETATEIVFLKQPIILMFLSLLKKQKQEKQRIQDLESKLEEANKQLDLDYVDKNYIPVEKVKEIVKEAIEIIESEQFKVIMGDVTKVGRLRWLLEEELLEDK